MIVKLEPAGPSFGIREMVSTACANTVNESATAMPARTVITRKAATGRVLVCIWTPAVVPQENGTRLSCLGKREVNGTEVSQCALCRRSVAVADYTGCAAGDIVPNQLVVHAGLPRSRQARRCSYVLDGDLPPAMTSAGARPCWRRVVMASIAGLMWAKNSL